MHMYMSNGMHLAFAFCWRVVSFIGHVLSGVDDLSGKIRMGRKMADNRMYQGIFPVIFHLRSGYR